MKHAKDMSLAEAIGRSFRNPLLRVLQAFGIDRAIAYSLLGRGWSAIAGPLNIFFIGRFLRSDEQGFYYTFGSVIGLYVFCELGLTFVLTQFASHEKAHLEWTRGRLRGPDTPRLRLAALLKLSLRWYSIASMLLLLVVLPIGLFFFSTGNDSAAVAWRGPWMSLVIASVPNLFAAPFFAILDGCGQVSEIALIRLGQSIMATLCVWAALISHCGLFAAAVYQAAYFLFGCLRLLWKYGGFFRSVLNTDVTLAPFDWWSEVWPFQWRIGLSWISSYCVSQSFAPILFASHGPVAAGKMGMSLSLSTSLLTASVSWMTTKTSPFGVLVRRGEWKTLDRRFFRALRDSTLALFLAGGVLFILVAVAGWLALPLSGRLLGPLPFGLVLVSTLMTHVLFCEAQYLRTHKEEPFLWMSVPMCVVTISSAYLLAPLWGILGVSIVYLVYCGIGLALGTRIFHVKRHLWHLSAPSSDETAVNIGYP